MDDTNFLYGLFRVPGIGPKTIRHLIDTFGSAKSVWNTSREDLRNIASLGEKPTEALCRTRDTLDLKHEEERLQAQDISLLEYRDPNFPSLLGELPDAPALLFLRGSRDTFSHPRTITIVGTRSPSHYGTQVAETLTRELVRSGFVTVSGLALGVDGIVHQKTLEGGGGTIAVLAGGIDNATIAPRSHLSLAQSILARGGTILSDYAPGTEPSVGTFPARNRIMAGLSPTTLVIEASEKSGTLITASLALEYNRDVFAVPGSIFSEKSRGCHRLIQEGARLIGSLGDIISELSLTDATRQTPSAEHIAPQHLSPEEDRVYRILTHEPLHIDKIVALSTLETMCVSSALSKLEMKGHAKNIGGMHYIKV